MTKTILDVADPAVVRDFLDRCRYPLIDFDQAMRDLPLMPAPPGPYRYESQYPGLVDSLARPSLALSADVPIGRRGDRKVGNPTNG